MNKEYLRLAYQFKMIAPTKEDADIALRIAVKTSENPFGFFTPAEYEELTGVKF